MPKVAEIEHHHLQQPTLWQDVLRLKWLEFWSPGNRKKLELGIDIEKLIDDAIELQEGEPTLVNGKRVWPPQDGENRSDGYLRRQIEVDSEAFTLTRVFIPNTGDEAAVTRIKHRFGVVGTRHGLQMVPLETGASQTPKDIEMAEDIFGNNLDRMKSARLLLIELTKPWE
ncbi:MAG: hypothetical protein UW86_C0003G0010 [Microgenomates group bacterium GW2011_GWA1_Microgenomates_45_10]|nr:MAG: hypothetical protein UW73_C0015G0010 [Microgenomates group bacterium GW2011_GWB1_44_8]KKT87365.1 MAG: hypothetical protein UW86_C0003G0010 [Microgenomates group bacterium GW2011_GWA1_Microgenomates_45_10]